MYQFMKKHRFLTLILSILFIMAFSGSAFAYSATYISAQYDFTAGVVNNYTRNHNTNCDQNFKEQWVAGESGWSNTNRTQLTTTVTRVPGSCHYHSTSAYKASYPSHIIYLRVSPTSGTIGNINGYAFTGSSNSCPYGVHA